MHPQRVGTWRRELEQAGEIEAASWQQRQARPRSAHTRGAGQRALAELRANPSRRVRAIAQAAGASHMTVLRARQQLASAAAQRAEAAWRALCLRQPERVPLPCQPTTYPGIEFPRGWPRESEAAVRLCTRYCHLLAQCRAHALGLAEQPPGVLGGMTLRERELARR